mmetsp:Transcript_74974/g.199937  ORF Transcript_74974/g.199937 Transcript_74974/m.199937 type:complete len:1465 (-) Transcript_74974:743-5137(-)
MRWQLRHSADHGHALLRRGVGAVGLALLFEALVPIGIPVDREPLLAVSHCFVLKVEFTLGLDGVLRLAQRAAGHRQARHLHRGDGGVRLACGCELLLACHLAAEAVAFRACELDRILVHQLILRGRSHVLSGLRRPTDVAGTSGILLALRVKAHGALAVVSVHLVVAHPRCARILRPAIVDVPAHLLAQVQRLLKPALALAVEVLHVGTGRLLVVHALPVAAAALSEGLAVIDVDALLRGRERSRRPTMKLVLRVRLRPRKPAECVPGVALNHLAHAEDQLALGGAVLELLELRLAALNGLALRHLRLRESAIGQALDGKLGLAIGLAVSAVPTVAGVMGLVVEEELPFRASSMLDGRRLAAGHRLAHLQLANRPVGVADGHEVARALCGAGDGVALRTLVLHVVLVDQRLGVVALRMSDLCGGSTDVALTGGIALDHLVESAGAGTGVGVHTVVASARRTRLLKRAIVDIRASLLLVLADGLLEPTLADARVIVDVLAGGLLMVFAIPVSTAGDAPRRPAVVEVGALLESIDLTVVLAGDVESSCSISLAGQGVPWLAAQHFLGRVEQGLLALASRVLGHLRLTALHRLALLSLCKAAVSLALNLERRLTLWSTIDTVSAVACVSHLLLEHQGALGPLRVGHGRWHAALHGLGRLGGGIRPISLACHRIRLFPFSISIQRIPLITSVLHCVLEDRLLLLYRLAGHHRRLPALDLLALLGAGILARGLTIDGEPGSCGVVGLSVCGIPLVAVKLRHLREDQALAAILPARHLGGVLLCGHLLALDGLAAASNLGCACDAAVSLAVHLEGGRALWAPVECVPLDTLVLGGILEPLEQDLGDLGNQLRVILPGRSSAHDSLARSSAGEATSIGAIDAELEIGLRHTGQSVALVAHVVGAGADIALLLGGLRLRVGWESFPLHNPHSCILDLLRHPADLRGTGLVPCLTLLFHRNRMPPGLVALAGVGVHVVHAGPGLVARELGRAVVDVAAELLSAGLHDLFEPRIALAPVKIIRVLGLCLHLLALAIWSAVVHQTVVNLHDRGNDGELAAGKALQRKLGVRAFVRVVIAAQGMTRRSSVGHNGRKEHVALHLRGCQLNLRRLPAQHRHALIRLGGEGQVVDLPLVEAVRVASQRKCCATAGGPIQGVPLLAGERGLLREHKFLLLRDAMLHHRGHATAYRHTRRRGRESAICLALSLEMSILLGSVRRRVQRVPLSALVLANLGKPHRCTRVIRVQGLPAELVIRRRSAHDGPALLGRGELATCLTSDQELLGSSSHSIQRVPLDTLVLSLIGVHQGLVHAGAVPRARQIRDELPDLPNLHEIPLAAGPLHLRGFPADHWHAVFLGRKQSCGLALNREIRLGGGVASDGETKLTAILSGIREKNVGAGVPTVLHLFRSTAILRNAHGRANPVPPSVHQTVAKLLALDGVRHKVEPIHALDFASRVRAGVTPAASLLHIRHRRRGI